MQPQFKRKYFSNLFDVLFIFNFKKLGKNKLGFHELNAFYELINR